MAAPDRVNAGVGCPDRHRRPPRSPSAIGLAVEGYADVVIDTAPTNPDDGDWLAELIELALDRPG